MKRSSTIVNFRTGIGTATTMGTEKFVNPNLFLDWYSEADEMYSNNTIYPMDANLKSISGRIIYYHYQIHPIDYEYGNK